MSKSPLHLLKAIEERKSKNLFRELKNNFPGIDFCSNDYLGFSKSGLLHKKTQQLFPDISSTGSARGMNPTGSTGSRLISGNSKFIEETEQKIASFHNSDVALLFNSGYDANVGLMSSVPQKGDLVLYDELIHASLYDGIRLSHATHYKFKHNQTEQLEELIKRHQNTFKTIYVVVESIYSMDGDEAPLKKLTALKNKYKLFLIVDEAHAIGVFGKKGRGLCNELGIETEIFARIYTYGKAMGCHGAAIAGDKILRNYLINFARSFIYTTALPPVSIATINAAYELLQDTKQIEALNKNISYFNAASKKINGFIPSRGAIHCKIVKGNMVVDKIEKLLAAGSVYIKAIKSPTVKAGEERLRICLHAFNTEKEIKKLLTLVQ